MSTFVALTTTIDPAGGDYRKPRIALYANYVGVLQSVGLTPILISPAHDSAAIGRLMAVCSGLVLTGGADIDPSRYGEDPIPELGEVNPPRDAAEFRAMEIAAHADIPILGICRGHQLINVFFGGTLCQDIEVAMGEAYSHLQTSPWGEHHHEVMVEDGSLLRRAVGQDRLAINSYHHQAIKDVAPNLDVTARAVDGLIEAVESRDHRWVVGVQWHPERHEARDADSKPDLKLFTAFAEAVRSAAPAASAGAALG